MKVDTMKRFFVMLAFCLSATVSLGCGAPLAIWDCDHAVGVAGARAASL